MATEFKTVNGWTLIVVSGTQLQIRKGQQMLEASFTDIVGEDAGNRLLGITLIPVDPRKKAQPDTRWFQLKTDEDWKLFSGLLLAARVNDPRGI